MVLRRNQGAEQELARGQSDEPDPEAAGVGSAPEVSGAPLATGGQDTGSSGGEGASGGMADATAGADDEGSLDSRGVPQCWVRVTLN
jgi:hypothetical protein